MWTTLAGKIFLSGERRCSRGIVGKQNPRRKFEKKIRSKRSLERIFQPGGKRTKLWTLRRASDCGTGKGEPNCGTSKRKFSC
tara:strand:- start:1086 stop:1331 length:246 start_codon:yes stop_codon:yes gene_type:complete